MICVPFFDVYRLNLHSTQIGRVGESNRYIKQVARDNGNNSSPAERHSLSTALCKQGEVTGLAVRERERGEGGEAAMAAKRASFPFLPDGNAVTEIRGWGKAPGFIHTLQSGGVRPTAALMDRLNARRRQDLRMQRSTH